jgi:hypothetical protein
MAELLDERLDEKGVRSCLVEGVGDDEVLGVERSVSFIG